MRYRLFVMLAMLPALAAAEELTVLMQAGSSISGSVESSLHHEVESLLSASGIRVSWDDLQAKRIAVIRLDGSCTADLGMRSAPLKAESLGKTHLVNGSVLPIADIRCDAVRQYIAPELRRTRSEQREEMLGRALGRVVSHELYHILLRTTEHGKDGIARPAQSSRELVMERAAFARTDERRLATSSENESSDGDVGSGR